MNQQYVVVRGDTLTRIAQKFHKRSWREIYDAPENAAFRRRRPDPDRIQPGDLLVIPGIAPAAPPPRIDGIVPVVGTDDGSGMVHVSDPDGVWEVVMVSIPRIIMNVHKRNRGLVTWRSTNYALGIPGQPHFEQTLTTVRAGRPDCLIVQGAFQNMPSPISFDKGYLMGRLVIGGDATIRVTPDDMERRERAAISFFNDASRSPSGGNFHFSAGPNGAPAVGCDHGMGSLIAVVMEGKKRPDDSFWVDQVRPRGAIGWTVVAQRRSDQQLMIWSQRDPSQSTSTGGRRATPDALRDGLVDAGFDDAVLLDGSDSILFDINGRRLINPGSMKQRMNQTFLSFTLRARGAV
jgi:hypothetical protein